VPETGWITAAGEVVVAGVSTTKLVGRAPNMRGPGDIAGTYAAVGAGGTLAGGVGSVQLENGSGVIL
jgi:hypothetical protein